MRRVSVLLLAIVIFAACSEGASTRSEGSGASSTSSSSTSTTTTTTTVVPVQPSPFEGWGTWVDAYDYSPAYQETGEGVSVTPADVDAMADAGVRTLYLQAAKDDLRSRGDLVDEALVAQFLTRAHARGVQVVAWFLPLHVDTARATFAGSRQ